MARGGASYSGRMNKPASAPDVIPEPPRRPRDPLSESDGNNATQHEPSPKADPTLTGDRKHVPRSPFTTGND